MSKDDYRNPAFHEALRAYMQAAIASLAARGAPRDVPLSAYTERGYKWVPAEHDNNGTRSAYTIAQTATYPKGFLESIAKLKEAAACAKALQCDPQIYQYFDQCVGVLSFFLRMDVRRCLALFWGSYAAKSAGRDFDESLFEDEYCRLEQDLYSDTVKVRVVAPLIGCQFDGAIRLQDGLAIEPMQPDDEIRYIETTSETLVWDVRTELPKIHAIVYEACLSKRIYRADQRNDDGMKWMNVMNDVITALCVFKDGGFVVEGFLVTSGSIFCAGIQRLGQRQRYGRDGWLHVKEADAGGLADIFLALSTKTIKSHDGLGTALCRFLYASERGREEDRLVDLLIAAESLFLLKDEKTELSYRLRQRVALLLGTTVEDRLKIAEDIRTAYDCRSKVVHGGREIRKEPLNVITPTIEGYLRASLRKAVNLAVSNNTGPKKAWMEWDKMIYEKCGALVTPAEEDP